MREKKQWWKSKTIWTGVATIATVICKHFGIPVPEEVLPTLIGLGLITGRVSKTDLSK